MTGFVIDNQNQEIRVGTGGIKIDPGATDLLTVQNGILLPDGSVTEPALRFADDTNTGLYSPSQEVVAIGGNGVRVAAFNGTTGTISFGDDTTDYEFPATRGSNGQILQSDANGLLSWVDPPTGAAGYLYSGTITTEPTANGEDTIVIGDGSQGGTQNNNIVIGKSSVVNNTNLSSNIILLGRSITGDGGGQQLNAFAVNASQVGSINLNRSAASRNIIINTTNTTVSTSGGVDQIALLTNAGATFNPSGNSVTIGYPAGTSCGLQSVQIGSFGNATSAGSISIGANNNCTGDRAVCVGSGGSSNNWNATGSNSVAIGSGTATNHGATGTQSVAIGYLGRASNSASIAIGSACVASGVYSIAIGNQSSSTATGSITLNATGTARTNAIEGSMMVGNATTNCIGAYASQLYNLTSVSGGAQYEEIMLRVLTSAGAGYTNRVFVANNTKPSLIANSAWTFTGLIVASTSDFTIGKSFQISGGIRKGAANTDTTLIGTPNVTVLSSDTGSEGWSISVLADTSDGTLRVEANGDSDKTIVWVARISTVEMRV